MSSQCSSSGQNETATPKIKIVDGFGCGPKSPLVEGRGKDGRYSIRVPLDAGLVNLEVVDLRSCQEHSLIGRAPPLNYPVSGQLTFAG